MIGSVGASSVAQWYKGEDEMALLACHDRYDTGLLGATLHEGCMSWLIGTIRHLPIAWTVVPVSIAPGLLFWEQPRYVGIVQLFG